ncbi:MAG: type II secretion system F family protein, partial [Planctomycetota bacterium]
MNQREDRNVAEHVAQVAASGGALPAGLRAAAAETESYSVARELNRIAQRLESGQSLVDAIDTRHGVSRFIARAIESGMPSDQFDDVLVELNDFHAQQRDIFRDLWICLTYPLILVAILVAVVVLCFGFIVPEIGHTIVDMWQIEGGNVLNAAMWMSTHGFWYVLWTLLGIAGGCAVIRMAIGAAKWRWIVGSLPLFGSLLNWNSSWEFARRLELLLKRNVSLPDALTIVGDELRDANMADVSQRLSRGCHAGQPMHHQLGETVRVLPTVTTFIQWGEENGTLCEALSLISETMKDRIRARTAMMSCVIPPVTFLTVAALSIAVAGTILGPMVEMIRVLGTFGGIGVAGADS